MAAGEVTRGTRTVLPNVSRLNALANNQAKTFGEITAGTALDYSIRMKFDLGASSSGYLQIYMVESQDGTEWTDDIDPTDDTANIAAKIKDAIHIMSVDATFVTTNHETAEVHFNVCDHVSFPCAYFGFAVLNDGTGDGLDSSLNDGDYQSISISAS